MFDFVIQKMLNRKWIVLCLLIGNVLLVGIACCNPMYTNAIQQRTIRRTMSQYVVDENTYPGTVILDAQMESGDETSGAHMQDALDQMKQMQQDVPLDVRQEVYHYYLTKNKCTTANKYGDSQAEKELAVGFLEDLPNHMSLVTGEMYKDSINADGTIDAIISQKGLVKQKMLLGEVLTFDTVKLPDGRPLKVKITGVFENSSADDLYWVNSPSTFTSEILISETVFRENFLDMEHPAYQIRGAFYTMFDTDQIRSGNIDRILEATRSYQNHFTQQSGVVFRALYTSLLEEHQVKIHKVISTLQVLQVPILVLVAAFIFMVSRQILEIEKNDIAIIKSRGASKKQILISYLIQSSLLAGAGFVLGLPLAMILCQVFGSANAFLSFVQRQALSLGLSWSVLLYGLAAVLLSIAAMVLPVFQYAKLTIVEHKRRKSGKYDKPWWQRFYVDFLLLLVSLYGLYSFSRQKDMLTQSVAQGASLDPLLFFSSSLFIIGCGLIALRVIPLILHGIYWLGKKKWNPAIYASFLRVLRTRTKQYFIMAFLILTIALGIFNAKAARTINQNEEDRIAYTNGADVVLQERWTETLDSGAGEEAEETEAPEATDNELQAALAQLQGTNEEETISADDYTEPDPAKYAGIEGVTNTARVYVTDKARVSVSINESNQEQLLNKYREQASSLGRELSDEDLLRYARQFGGTYSQPVTLMGISTKEFGETAWFKSGLLPVHWYNYLNAISQNSSALLVSSNFHNGLGYELGDEITYTTATGEQVRGWIFGFVDYWPTYLSQVTTTDEDGTSRQTDQYIIVANLSRLQAADGVLPYQIWMKVDGSTQPVYDFIGEKQIKLESFVDTNADVIDMKNDPQIQGTNGILTVGFVIVLILCAVGFLIYWIISIQSRTLQFGIFRAMGMSMKEIIVMLIGEQLFITLPALIMGVFIGLAAANLYMPLIQIAYAATDHALPLSVAAALGDIVKMFVVVVILIGICMAVLGWLISKLKITQALKLGED